MARATRARTTSPKTPKSATAAAPEKKNGHGAADVESTIRVRAYELYVQRGRQDGFDQDDWFQAEAEVLGSNNRRTA